jgi:hypothetical protein
MSIIHRAEEAADDAKGRLSGSFAEGVVQSVVRDERRWDLGVVWLWQALELLAGATNIGNYMVDKAQSD